MQVDPEKRSGVFSPFKRNEEAKAVLTAGSNAAQSGRSSGGKDLVPEMRALIESLG